MKIKIRKQPLYFSMVTSLPCPLLLNSSPPLSLPTSYTLFLSFPNLPLCLFFFLGTHSLSMAWNVLRVRLYHTCYMYILSDGFQGKGTHLTCRVWKTLDQWVPDSSSCLPCHHTLVSLDPSVSFYTRGPAVHLPTQREPEINPDAFQM